MATLTQFLVKQLDKRFDRAIFHHNTNENVIALTIDDVPKPNDPDDQSTQLILDTIATHNQQLVDSNQHVRATFFIISSHLDKDSTIIQRMISEGHEIANHGVADDRHYQEHPAIFNLQINSAHHKISEYSSQQLRLYRPGWGLYNQTMIETLAEMAQQKNYESHFALASMLPFDTAPVLSNPRFTAWYLAQHIFPGSILVLHGGPERRGIPRSANTAKVLKHFLSRLLDKYPDYRVTTLGDLLSIDESASSS